MTKLPPSLPRVPNLDGLQRDPLHFLENARATLGDIVVLRDGGPILSRSPDCAGAITVFGADHTRAVLTDADAFGMPISAARHLSLPPALVNLNQGAHSRRGEEHVQHRRALLSALSNGDLEATQDAIEGGLEKIARRWPVGERVGLLSLMRGVMLRLSSRLLFGDDRQRDCIAELARAYFDVRREAASPLAEPTTESREELIALGMALDDALRGYFRRGRKRGAGTSPAVLATLSRTPLAEGRPFEEDELVAHANVLFMSSNEPVAIALTWILLILSQLPRLRQALRRELDGVASGSTLPRLRQLMRLDLLDSVISEGLRLLPPNALMVRVTRRPIGLADMALPERCEVVLCPFLAHRDPARFPNPRAFRPERWKDTAPTPFEYLPFGAGAHHCVGRALALLLIKATLAFVIGRYDLVLAEDQPIGWRIHIQLMPSEDPMVLLRRADLPFLAAGGRLLGAIGEMVDLTDDTG
jgi:cytochrome P450